MERQTEYTWKVNDIQEETPQVKSIYLSAITNRPDFIAGQYLTVKLPNLGPVEGKAYSISSMPHEALIRITVKKMGTFSDALLSLKTGDILTTSKPYGFFYPDVDGVTPLVFLAGGIGITPILSILKDLSHKNDPRPLFLFYSNRTEQETVLQNELSVVAEQNPHLSVHCFITRETLVADGYIAGRMTPAHLQKFVPASTSADYFLCGSMDFTKSLWKTLRANGIQQHQIYTEGFF
ncbi:hypothetical protein GW766_03305 [Candidatus Parcubacteria bacterium]|nr:hypothetical protein [Candidatus Parcubacteria bacterium]